MEHLIMPDLNYIKSILDYSPDSGIFTWKVSNSNRVKVGDVAGCLWVNTKNPEHKYYKIKINGKRYMLHRLAYYYITGIDPAENEVDHINGNSLDNRFENLRIATHADNGKNQKKPKDNTSGFKGVVWNKQKKKWQASIKVNNKRIYLGCYNTSEEASAAYQSAAENYFKDFKRSQDLE
jgi:hypothetical protein